MAWGGTSRGAKARLVIAAASPGDGDDDTPETVTTKFETESVNASGSGSGSEDPTSVDSQDDETTIAGTVRQGLTLVHFPAQLERFVWNRRCA
jgi:hypothetical protein